MRNKNVFSTFVALGALGASFAFSASGCSSEDSEGSGGTGGTGGKGGGAAIDCTKPAGIQQCKTQALAQGSCAEVGGCACDNCCPVLQDCEADPQCVEIRKCGQATGCRGIACYQAATCMAVVDANGGPTGLAAGITVALSNCLAGNPAAMPPVPAACPITMCP